MPAPSDLVHELSTTTGTGNCTLVNVNGKRSFNTAFSTGGTDLFDYYISNRDAAEWERGTGHLSASTTLVRDTVIASSNANAAVNFSAGTKDVTNDVPAAKQLRNETQSLSSSEQAVVRANLYASPFDAMAFDGMQVNGGVDISQELLSVGATLTNNTNRYIADCWESMYNHGAATAVVTSAQVANASFPSTLNGYSFGHQVKATTAISSPANGDFARHRHQIEGQRVARLAWGTSGAQSISVALQLYSTASGTAFLRVTNSAGNRAYHTEITVSAGWNFVTKTIAGDTSGTWQTFNASGIILDVYVSGKTASPATPDAWGATPAIQTTNSTNLLGTNNNTTIVTGLFVVPGIELPNLARHQFLLRPHDTEMILCQRYLEKSAFITTAILNASDSSFGALTFDTTIANNDYYDRVFYKVRKRNTSTVTTYPFTTPSNTARSSNSSGTDYAASSAVVAFSSEIGFWVQNQSGGALTVTGGGLILYGWYADSRF